MGYRVLIVEDELPMRQEMEQYYWEEMGYQFVDDVGNGKQALNCCR